MQKLNLFLIGFLLLFSTFSFAQDSFEPNDMNSQATSVNIGSNIMATLHTSDDLDIYAIQITQSGILEVRMSNLPESGRYFISYEKGDEGVVGGNSIGDSNNPAFNPLLVCEADTYYILIDRWDGSVNENQAYNLEINFDASDNRECNNSYEDAASIGLNTTLNASIYGEGDLDFYKIEVPYGGVLDVRLTVPTPNMRISVKIEDGIDFQGNLSVAGAGSPGVLSELLCVAGTYFLIIERWDGNVYEKEPYELNVSFYEDDVYECNNINGNAVPINPCQTIVGSIYPRGDEDWYEVAINNTGNYTISVTGVPANIAIATQVIDQFGNRIVNCSNAAGFPLDCNFDITTTGTYFLVFHDDNSNEFNTELYQFSTNIACNSVAEICDNGLDDDEDGLVDCDDPDCTGNPACDTGGISEICNNGIDDDGDGLIDCDDSDCTNDPACDTGGISEICNNGIDDDDDGLIDCDDPDCVEADNCNENCMLSATANPTPPDCEQSNGSISLIITGDNDFNSFLWSNGATTESISGLPAGTYAVTIEDMEVFCTFTLEVTLPDGCGETEICDNGIDDDGDDLIDCEDPDCANAPNCEPTGECNITAGTLTFPDSPYEIVGPGSVSDVVGIYTAGNIPTGYSIRFIKNFTNREFLSIRNVPEFSHSSSPGQSRMYFIIGQFDDSNDPNYIDIDNTDFEDIDALEAAMVDKCALLDFATYTFLLSDDYILTAEEATGPANTPILLPITLINGECANIKAIQGRFLFSGQVDVTILGYQSGKINASTIETDNTTRQNFAWSSASGVDLSLTESDTLFYLEVSLSGQPNEVSRVSFDIEENPLVRLTCSEDLTLENMSLGVGLVRIISEVEVDGLVRFWKDNTGIPDVTMNLVTNNAGNFTELTDSQGDYNFTNIPTGGNATLTPIKNNGSATNGLTVLDALLLKQFVVGLVNAESDYQRVAMEVTGDEFIDVLDALLIQYVIVGNRPDFGSVPNWYFIPADYNFPTPTAADYFDFPTDISLSNIVDNISESFIGVKTGDVDGSADPNGLRAEELEIRSQQTWLYHITDQSEDYISIGFSPSEGATFSAFQTSFSWSSDLELMDIERGSIDNILFNTSNPNEAKLLWVSDDGREKTFNAEENLMTLVFKKNNRNQEQLPFFKIKSEDVSLIVNESLEQSNLSLTTETLSSVNNLSNYYLHQNNPNPFSDFTEIRFDTPQNQKATLSIYDAFGKVVYSKTANFNVGENSLLIKVNNWQSGWYTYVLKTSDYLNTKRMLLIK